MGAGLYGHRRAFVACKIIADLFFCIAHFGNVQLLTVGIKYNGDVILVSQIHSNCDSVVHGWSPFFAAPSGDCVNCVSMIVS